MKTKELLAEIHTAFPLVDMPSKHELRFNSDDSWGSDLLAEELDQNRGAPVDGAVIRSVHQDMSLLSAKTWRWILPHYLTFCVTGEPDDTGDEIQFLVYGLNPREEYRDETLERLSLLDARQIRCLIHFVEWLRVDREWNGFFLGQIAEALSFLRSI